MKMVFVCASVNRDNAVVGDTIDRALAFKAHPSVSGIEIISLHGNGTFSCRGIRVHCVGSDKKGKIGSLWSFLKLTLDVYQKFRPDFFYFYMCPSLAPWLCVNGLRWKTNVVQWFVHTKYNLWNQISLKYCTDLWFNTNESMAPFKVHHQRLVGHGVKCDDFTPDANVQKVVDLITVSRISPVKNLDKMLEVLAYCRDNFGKRYSIDICGDAFVESDFVYKKYLIELIEKLEIQDQVHFSGMVSRDDLLSHYRKAKLFLFLQTGGIGKVTLESFACGVPAVTAWPEASDFFGKELSKWVVCERDVPSIGIAIHRILQSSEEDYQRLCLQVRDLFLNNYTLEKLINRIVTTIQSELNQGRER